MDGFKCARHCKSNGLALFFTTSSIRPASGKRQRAREIGLLKDNNDLNRNKGRRA